MTERVVLTAALVAAVAVGCGAERDVDFAEKREVRAPFQAGASPRASALLGVAPAVFANRFHQSPVRGGPGDLLLIAGDGFTTDDVVVYQRTLDTTRPIDPPPAIPETSTPELGTAPVIRYGAAALTVRLPAVMTAGQSYTLWVARPVQDPPVFSAALPINDARPLWVTPPLLYRTATVPGLLRQLKVVGRNLDAAPGAVTKVRLTPLRKLTPVTALAAAIEPVPELNEVVARVSLPPALVPGLYAVDVSRDGTSWENVSREFRVLPDPASPAIHDLALYGCSPDDGRSDTGCVAAAIAAAREGGGVVFFGAGTWNLDPDPAVDPTHGLVLPRGVGLRGASVSSTRVVRHGDWGASAVFTLQGQNTIERLTLADPVDYRPGPNGPNPHAANTFLQLGKWPWLSEPADPTTVDDVVISGNVFKNPYWAITDGNLPISRLVIADNEFGAFHDSIFLFGPINVMGPANVALPRFRVIDSIISRNRFYPGAFQEGYQGVIASHVGAATRVDVSDNVIDGRDTRYLVPGDKKGFRAGLFFNTNNNHEMLLVSRNVASCTGDKGGDGEGIAFDGYKNRVAFKEPLPLLGATPSSVTVGEPALIVDPPDYFSEHWVIVMDGKGAGQARKVTAHSHPAYPPVTFDIAPPWDVVPDTSTSRISVGRNDWQVATAANEIDIRGCVKPPGAAFGPRSKSGEIVLYGMMTDSAIVGNIQHETDGITLAANYWLDTNLYQIDHQGKYFVEVRGNTIDDEFDYCSALSYSGILFDWNVSPGTMRVPLLGVGITVADNRITRADGPGGGAIDFAYLTSQPPAARYFENTLIFDNDLRDIVAMSACDSVLPRFGIHIQSLHVPPETQDIRKTTLSGNRFTNVDNPLRDVGAETIVLP